MVLWEQWFSVGVWGLFCTLPGLQARSGDIFDCQDWGDATGISWGGTRVIATHIPYIAQDRSPQQRIVQANSAAAEEPCARL